MPGLGLLICFTLLSHLLWPADSSGWLAIKRTVSAVSIRQSLWLLPPCSLLSHFALTHGRGPVRCVLLLLTFVNA